MMAWLRNTRKKIQSILTKIGKGRATETDTASLIELLDEEPSAVPEVIAVLADILKKENTNAYRSVVTVLNAVAEKEPELVVGSLNAIIGCIRNGEKEIHRDWILGSLDILFKISLKYPEKMRVAMSDLIMCLENISMAVREKAYFLLALLAIMKPELFIGHSKELVRVLNGLNIDERIYACKLIKKIGNIDPKIVADTYDVLEDMRLNHIDSSLRSEAAYAVETLKVKDIIKQKPSGSTKAGRLQPEKRKRLNGNYIDIIDSPDISFSELVSLIVPNEEEIKEMLIGLGFNHLIMKR